MTLTNEKLVGAIAAMAVRPAREAPMREIDLAVALRGAGIEGDYAQRRRRGITFLAKRQWDEVTRELGAALPWHARRANVLVDAPTLEPLIGRVLRVGKVRVRIHAETEPCAKMDARHAGLQAALRPSCRGGVYGEVLEGGTLRVGDAVWEA